MQVRDLRRRRQRRVDGGFAASSWPALAAASDTAAYALDTLYRSVIFAAAAIAASS